LIIVGVPGKDSQSTVSFTTTTSNRTALDVLGHKSKELMNGMRFLRELGVEELNVPLPIIVVVGDQSAGKSSAVEGLSELRVPRSGGTCTRCPLEINLTTDNNPDASWKCTVSLHTRYSHFGKTRGNQSSSLGPWILNKDAPKDFVFEKIRDQKDLEESIKWAQIATLNPAVNPSEYQPYRDGRVSEGLQVHFSPNIVKLVISGPNLPNLSFIDLPGVINQHRDGEEVVQLVRNLVQSYIETENSLILLACSLEVDLDVSTAAGIVRNLDATSRCFCVLTKPDRLPTGKPDGTLELILRNEKFEFGHGYFVTKQPSQEELEQGITHSIARVQERQFFELNEPWRSELSAFKGRFGTEQLQEALSQELTVAIFKSLPKTMNDVKVKIQDIDLRLQTLPEPPAEDSLRLVVDLLNKFKAEVELQMKGEYPDNKFMQHWGEKAENCRAQMFNLRPTLVVKTTDEQNRKVSVAQVREKAVTDSTKKDVMQIDSDQESEVNTPMPAFRKRYMGAQINTPLAKRTRETPQTPSSKSRRSGNEDQKPNQYINLPMTELAEKLNLDTVHETLCRASHRNIPDLVHPKAVELLISSSIQHWEIPITSWLRDTEKCIRDYINQTMSRLLTPWATTQLHRDALESIDTFVTGELTELRAVVTSALALEHCKPPITLNQKMWKHHELEEARIFQKARRDWLANLHLDEIEAINGKWTIGSARDKQLKSVTNEQLGTDSYSREIEVFAKVRGYYNFASDRLVDNVFQSIHFKLFERCRGKLHDHLADDLRVHEHDGKCTP